MGRDRRRRARPRSGTRRWRRRTGSRPGTSSEQVLAGEEQDADRPRVRERIDLALGAEAVGLEIALDGHSSPRAEVAVLARDELAEALDVLQRARAVRLAEPHQLRQADETERVQMLVRGARCVCAAGFEPVAAEQRVLWE